MSWSSMALELSGTTPVPYPYALSLVNRAWLDIQRSFLWSFLWGDAAVPTPMPISQGSCTTVSGLNQVLGDATASALWLTAGLVNPITVRQFRVGQGTIYNINSITDNGDGTATLTLASPYVDPTVGSGVSYQIQQNYYSGPTQDFLWWESIRDPISGYTLVSTFTREEVDIDDPQRFQSGWPRGVIPYGINRQTGNFLNYPMMEIWPCPLNGYTYVGTYFRSGAPFINLADTVQYPLGEDVVLAQAKYRCYEWCVANPDKVAKHEGSLRTGASGYQFLLGAATKEKSDLLNDYILMDETFSNRHMIADIPKNYLSNLPWVSMKAGLLYTGGF